MIGVTVDARRIVDVQVDVGGRVEIEADIVRRDARAELQCVHFLRRRYLEVVILWMRSSS